MIGCTGLWPTSEEGNTTRRRRRALAAGAWSSQKMMTLLVLFLAVLSQLVYSFTPRPSMAAPAIRVSSKLKLAFSSKRAQNDESQLSARSSVKLEAQIDEDDTAPKKTTSPTPVFFKFLDEMNEKSAALTTVTVLAFLLTLNPLPSNAAMSGGRMGGSFSESTPSRPPSGSLSAPSRSYDRGYSSGFRSGYSSSPRIMVSPYVAPPMPFYSPFGGYGYGGPAVVTYGGPSIFSLLIFGVFAFTAFSAFTSIMGKGETSSFDSSAVQDSVLGPGTSFIQVTVGLDVPNRDDRNSILNVLGRLARTASTDSRVGIQNLTSQVALELLRRKSSIVSAYTSCRHFNNRSKALREFNNRAIQERGKFETETVSNYGGVEYGQGSGDSLVVGDKATKAVVTLLLSIDGDSTKVPKIRSVSDVEDALRRIAADAKVEKCLQSAEILWTPENRSETLSERDVAADYPELRSV